MTAQLVAVDRRSRGVGQSDHQAQCGNGVVTAGTEGAFGEDRRLGSLPPECWTCRLADSASFRPCPRPVVGQRFGLVIDQAEVVEVGVDELPRIRTNFRQLLRDITDHHHPEVARPAGVENRTVVQATEARIGEGAVLGAECRGSQRNEDLLNDGDGLVAREARWGERRAEGWIQREGLDRPVGRLVGVVLGDLFGEGRANMRLIPPLGGTEGPEILPGLVQLHVIGTERPFGRLPAEHLEVVVILPEADRANVEDATVVEREEAATGALEFPAYHASNSLPAIARHGLFYRPVLPTLSATASLLPRLDTSRTADRGDNHGDMADLIFRE